MLTPQEIQQANQVTGFNVPTTGTTASSRADQVRALAQTPSAPTPEPGVVSRIGTDLSKRGEDLDKVLSSDQHPAEKGLHIVGQGAGFVGDVAGEAMKGVLNSMPNAKTQNEEWAKDPLVQLAGHALQKGGEIWNVFKQHHPDAAQIAEDLGNIATVVPIGMGTKTAVKEVQSVVKEIPKVAETTTETIKGAKTIKAVANATEEAKAIDHYAGTIVQGKAADIKKAREALTSIDPTKVKSYQDLSGALDEKVKNLSTKLDETLATKTDVKKIDDLTLKSKVGDETVSHNYVTDAVKQLKEHYASINDPEGLAKVSQLEKKATDTGLTIKEIEDLAKEHGQSINAFNANGQAASGLSKQAAENTRSGLKSTARELFGDDVYKAVDTQRSALIRTRDLSDKMVEEVNKLQQKIKERTLGEKAGRLLGTVVNLIGLNSPKGFVEYFMGRGTGLKTLNAVDLEKDLQKNLKNLQKATGPNATDTEIESALQKIIDEAPKTEGTSK